MSHSGKINSEGGLNTLADRFKKSLKYDHKTNDNDNKPDYRELGSPVSPLRPNVVATSSRSSSSSSSSSGSFSGRNDPNPVPKKSDSGSTTTTNSGELSGSGHNSPTFSGRVKKQPVTRSSDSCGSHLVYSGGGSVSSPPATALPAGNICPLGKILKADVSVGKSSRPDVLGTGRGHYGHGSIMRGGGSVKFDGGSGSGGVGNSRPGELGGKGGMCGDGEELKRLGNEEYRRGHFSEALSLYDRAIAISPENAACHYNKAAALIGLKRLGMAVRECEEVLRLDPGYVRAHHRLGSLYLW